MDIASLMWDETGRDIDHEQRELARTAALNDAERLVGQFLYQAASDADLTNRLALADERLQAVASVRGYPMQDLTGDLKERWRLLSQARTATAQKTAAVRQVTAAQERAMDAVAARLAAVAARQNPSVPMSECLKLAVEAVRKHADAYPLAYESWGGTADGPITNRVKNFTPGNLPKSYDPSGAPDADPGMFDSVHKRLDDMETKLAGPSSPSGPASGPPSGPAGPGSPTTASLEPTVAGFFERLKDWWHGPSQEPTTAPAPAAEERAPYMIPSNNAASDHVDDAVARHHDEQGRREFDEIMRRLDSDQAEMNHKWDTAREDRFESPAETNQRTRYLQDAHDRRTTDMERRLDEMGRTPSRLPFSHAEPEQSGSSAPLDHPAPASFSHADTGASGGQQVLPTDPAEHAFSHRASLQHSLFE
jgi:hypothetical protein